MILWESRIIDVEFRLLSSEVIPFNSFLVESKVFTQTIEYLFLNYIPNEKPIIGSIRLFGLFTIETIRLVSVNDLSNSSVIRFWEYRSSRDNNLFKFVVITRRKNDETYLTKLWFICWASSIDGNERILSAIEYKFDWIALVVWWVWIIRSIRLTINAISDADFEFFVSSFK